MKINRLLGIVMLLLSKGTVTAKYLAGRFDVSVRTIYRDIDELTLSGIPIYTNKGKGGGISLLEDYPLNSPFLACQDKGSMPLTLEALYDVRQRERGEDDRIQKYEAIWNRFMQGMEFNHESIKKEILCSWKRCQKQGVSLYDFDMSLLMAPEEKYQYILKCLPEYEVSGFKEFEDIVETLHMNISIYDKHAKLKYIVNYDDVIDTVYPQVGYFKDASENQIGTNSTCLALAENRPFMVTGSEHYKYGFHQFSCVAVPFYNRKKEMAGTVNASFLYLSVNNDTLNIMYSLARLYERLVLASENPGEDKINREYKKSKCNLSTFEQILGHSENINIAKKMARKASQVDSPVLICGENGSGKKMFARAIHSASRRKDYPFADINCRAVPNDLMERELFGDEHKKGLLETASGGTLLIDEIESMPLYLQVKLEKVLLSSAIGRGTSETVPIDIRFIAAAKKDLPSQIKQGYFREDLFYMINIIQMHISPLRERKEDIRIIGETYMKKFSKKHGIVIKRIDDEFFEYLEAYHWPGNVRQLLNSIEKALVLSETGVIDASFLSAEIKESYIMGRLKKDLSQMSEQQLRESKTLLQAMEEMVIERVLKEENYNLSKTALRLGISRPTLNKKINKAEKSKCKKIL
ncbi:MAG: sigma 54-interacting transcriptional regulator [Firmicutes bacterium]|nr:sigma 54-interacting transcriptional regulator [Bacillota bacterium]